MKWQAKKIGCRWKNTTAETEPEAAVEVSDKCYKSVSVSKRFTAESGASIFDVEYSGDGYRLCDESVMVRPILRIEI